MTAAFPLPSLPRLQTLLETARQRVQAAAPWQACGQLVRATGLVMEATGLSLPVGAVCRVECVGGAGSRQSSGAGTGHENGTTWVDAEVVGFQGTRLFLMPQSDILGLPPGARVVPAPAMDKHLPVGDALLGRVLDGAGQPLDALPALHGVPSASLAAAPLNPLQRTPINTVLDVGVRAINALLTVGRGQRMGLFAGSGVGKSVLLGMMARYTEADVVVVGLIGERGREVKEFIEHNLGPEGLARSVVVAAPADVCPLLRLQGAVYATRLAEHFRDQGKHVLLIMDSLTRYAMAQREIALAIGEPPATKGYPPSVFAKLPALVERAGNGAHACGSLTAFYTVLAEGDDQQDPIADAARAILDGHIVLSRDLAQSGHYPAIDIEASISRVMPALITPEQLRLTHRFKQMMSSYQRNRDLIAVGAYSRGSDAQVDQAIEAWPRLRDFLQQGMGQRVAYDDAWQAMQALMVEVGQEFPDEV